MGGPRRCARQTRRNIRKADKNFYVFQLGFCGVVEKVISVLEGFAKVSVSNSKVHVELTVAHFSDTRKRILDHFVVPIVY